MGSVFNDIQTIGVLKIENVYSFCAESLLVSLFCFTCKTPGEPGRQNLTQQHYHDTTSTTILLRPGLIGDSGYCGYRLRPTLGPTLSISSRSEVIPTYDFMFLCALILVKKSHARRCYEFYV